MYHQETMNLSLIEKAEKKPLRIQINAKFATTAENVFGVIADLDGISKYFPMVRHAITHHNSATGCAGEGSVRVCKMSAGMGDINEEIIWWNPPAGFAYRASGTMIPIRDHLGVITLTPDTQGYTRIEWRHYFETRLGPLGWMFPFMMKRMCREALVNMAASLKVSVELS